MYFTDSTDHRRLINQILSWMTKGQHVAYHLLRSKTEFKLREQRVQPQSVIATFLHVCGWAPGIPAS